MYAVIKTGGKQYKVKKGDKLKVETLSFEEGHELTINEVLMVGDENNSHLGSPLLDGASVTAKVIGHGRGKKIRIIKFQRRKHHMKTQGHRQNFTEIEILSIKGEQSGS